jgi:hypothetical protein
LTVIPESTDLKAEIAASWKVFWNDEPLPFSVPLADAAAVGLDAAPVVAELDGELVLDEHAAARRVTTTALPSAATCFLPRSCISKFSLVGIAFIARRAISQMTRRYGPANRASGTVLRLRVSALKLQIYAGRLEG